MTGEAKEILDKQFQKKKTRLTNESLAYVMKYEKSKDTNTN